MTSSNSRCATFTNEADGVRLHHVITSFLTLKLDMFHRRVPLASFSRPKVQLYDNILAVVRSTDVKHDGRSQGLVAPNVQAQIAMQISLFERANLELPVIIYNRNNRFD